MLRRSLLKSSLAAASVLAVAACAAPQGEPDIVDVASSAGEFNTLVAAVTAADLVDTLKSPGPFTVFAPNDAAFAKLPEGTVEDLLKPENKDQLVAVLTYHVVAGEIRADELPVDGQIDVVTVEGSTARIDTRDGLPKIDNANIIATDIGASNGVIHVIDSVILP